MKKIFLLILAGFAVFIVWYKWEQRPVDASSSQRVTIEIPEGASVAKIGTLLAGENLIRSPRALSLYARFHGIAGKLQAGRFILRPAMSLPEVVVVLTAGKGEEISVTIPEGFTVKDIDALFTEKGITASGEILDAAQHADFSSFDFLPSPSGLAVRGGKLEGYLFPDTYFVSVREFVPKFFLERMLGTFRKKVIDAHADEFAASKRSLEDIMIMASLIEAETRTAEERPIVSGILWKRLDASQGLGVDATVRYILDKPAAAITLEDLDSQSPYNTRKFRGLPPGPIASPGITSILAAIKPKESPYWYYLHDTGGMIRYAVTNDEHNANRRRYLQ